MKRIMIGLGLLSSLYLQAGEYDFDMGAIEVKSYEYSGYLQTEYKYQHLSDSADTQHISLNEALLNFSYFEDIYKLNSAFSLRYDDTGEEEEKSFTIYDLYLNIKPSINHALDVGKKSLKWGKGYFFNPAAFFDRKKDPTQPENIKEGFILADYRYNKSFQGDLRNVMLDVVYLPTTGSMNQDFYDGDSNNLALKLYMLYHDTDIELIYAYSDTLNEKIGLTFSKNLETYFEIHGEFAKEINGPYAYLLGLKYVTESDVTITSEYLYQSDGLSEAEIEALPKLEPFSAKRYLVNKLSYKEPFTLLYSSIYFKDMLNLEDRSHLDSLGVTYSFKNSIEMDFSYNRNSGNEESEFGKKAVHDTYWLKLAWYF